MTQAEAIETPKPAPVAQIEPAPAPAPAAQLEPAPAADLSAGLSLLDALTGSASGPMLRVFSVKPDGTRGAIIATLPASESPDAIRARIERNGPGDYDLALVVGGAFVKGGSRRMTIDPPAPAAAPAPVAVPAAVAAPAADAAGLGVVLERMAAMQAASSAHFERLLMTMQTESKNAQLETMRLALEARGGGGGGGGDSITRDLMKAALPLLVAKMTEDPLDKLAKITKFQNSLREDANPAADNGAVWAGLASALATAVQAPAAAPARPAALPAPAATAPAPAAAGSPAPATPAPVTAPASLADTLRDLVPVLLKLAAKQADPGTVYAALGMLLDDAETAVLLPMLARPGAADMLLSAVPDLRGAADWLRQTVAQIAADVIADATGEAASNGAAG